MRTGVVGLGLIGGSLLRGLGGVGYDADPDARTQAAADGFAVVDALDGLAGCDLILVAVPPGITYDVSERVLAAVPGAFVADTASVKGEVPELDRFVAAHPMAGAETAGWSASSAGLLHRATWAVCASDPSLEPVAALGEAVDALDGRIVACEPGEHDLAVATSSHVPHAVATAIAASVVGEPLSAALAGNAFRDMTRVARSDSALWSAILAGNRAAVASRIDELVGRLHAMRDALGDPGDVAGDWAMGAEGLRLVDALGSERSWRGHDIVGGWSELVEHGREGRAVRRLRLEDGVLTAEVAR